MISFIDNMPFTLNKYCKYCNKQFSTTEINQTQIVKQCRPIDDFFSLTGMQINL